MNKDVEFKLFNFQTWRRKHFLWYGISSLLFSVISMYFFDHELSTFLRDSFGRSLYRTANMITWIGLGEIYFSLSIFGVLIFKGLESAKVTSNKVNISSLQKIFSTMFFSFLYSGIIAMTIKIIVGRCRPYNSPQYESLYFKHLTFDWNFHSYPSGHTQVVFTFATFMSLLFPKRTLFFLMLGSAVAVTRIVLEYHYLGDVIAGAFVGFIGTQIAFRRNYKSESYKNGYSKGI